MGAMDEHFSSDAKVRLRARFKRIYRPTVAPAGLITEEKRVGTEMRGVTLRSGVGLT